MHRTIHWSDIHLSGGTCLAGWFKFAEAIRANVLNKFLILSVDLLANHAYKIDIKPLNENTLLLIAVLFVGSLMFPKRSLVSCLRIFLTISNYGKQFRLTESCVAQCP